MLDINMVVKLRFGFGEVLLLPQGVNLCCWFFIHFRPQPLPLLCFMNWNLSDKLCPKNPFCGVCICSELFEMEPGLLFFWLWAPFFDFLSIVLYLKLNIILMTPFICLFMVHCLQLRNFVTHIYYQISYQWFYWDYIVFHPFTFAPFIY